MVTLLLIVVSFVATLVRSTFGFGESLVAVPLFALFVPLRVAVPLSVLMSVFVALVVVIQDHRHIEIYSAKWLILYAFLGIPVGLVVLSYGNEYWVKIGLGILIVLYSGYSILLKGRLALRGIADWFCLCAGFCRGCWGGVWGERTSAGSVWQFEGVESEAFSGDAAGVFFAGESFWCYRLWGEGVVGVDGVGGFFSRFAGGGAGDFFGEVF
ncbi:TSUP family transporter [Puia sp. P3]|uniref:TSUP family transporter n=1 Tax=Puia sp. P3 TaxID=3423952 RepID=UPI003D6733D1